MRTIVFFSIAFFTTCSAYAQSPAYARKLVDTLSSPLFWGRGYTNNGMGKAAEFIKGQFDSLGLEPLSGSYLQPFTYAVNTFPANLELSINGQVLKPGIDFIVSPESKGFSGTLKFTQRDSSNYIDADNRVALSLQDKLTWFVSDKQANYTLLIINRASLAGEPKTGFLKVDNKMVADFAAVNVCAKVTGTVHPDLFLVLSAHYDHLGGMGSKTYFPGANDNASGTALLLDLAAHYAKNPAPYTIVFIAFAGEEAGLKGSEYFVNNPMIDLKKTRFLLNLDLEGNGSEGITVVNATEFKKEFALLQKVNAAKDYLPAINARGKASNSDHYWFSERGVPAFFFYTLGGSKAYHDVFDVAENLAMDKYSELFNMVVDFNQELIK